MKMEMKLFATMFLLIISCLSIIAQSECSHAFDDSAKIIEITYIGDMSYCSGQKWPGTCQREATRKKNSAYDRALNDLDTCLQ